METASRSFCGLTEFDINRVGDRIGSLHGMTCQECTTRYLKNLPPLVSQPEPMPMPNIPIPTQTRTKFKRIARDTDVVAFNKPSMVWNTWEANIQRFREERQAQKYHRAVREFFEEGLDD